MYRTCWRGVVGAVYGFTLCVCPGLTAACIRVALAAGSARFAAFKLLKMRKELGISWWVLLSSIPRRAVLVSPLIPVHDLGKSARELSPAIIWQCRNGQCSCKRNVCPGRLPCFSAPLKWWINPEASQHQINLPLVIAWTIACGVLDVTLSCCAAARASPNGPTARAACTWVCHVLVRHLSQINFFFFKCEKVQWIPGGQPNQLDVLSLAVTNNPCFTAKINCLPRYWLIRAVMWGGEVLSLSPSSQTASSLQLCPLCKCRRILQAEESPALSVLEEMAKPWFCRHAVAAGRGSPPAVTGNCVGSQYQPVVMLYLFIKFIALIQPFCNAQLSSCSCYFPPAPKRSKCLSVSCVHLSVQNCIILAQVHSYEAVVRRRVSLQHQPLRISTSRAWREVK